MHIHILRTVFVSRSVLSRRGWFPAMSRTVPCTVSFHNFKSQNFKLSVSNPKSKYVAYLSVLSLISNCQGLGRKNKHEIVKTDRTVHCTQTRFGGSDDQVCVCVCVCVRMRVYIYIYIYTYIYIYIHIYIYIYICIHTYIIMIIMMIIIVQMIYSTRSSGKSAYQGKPHILAPVRFRMQAAGLQCLEPRLRLPFPTRKPAQFPKRRFPGKSGHPTFGSRQCIVLCPVL